MNMKICFLLILIFVSAIYFYNNESTKGNGGNQVPSIITNKDKENAAAVDKAFSSLMFCIQKNQEKYGPFGKRDVMNGDAYEGMSYLVSSMQLVDTSNCPQDFRYAVDDYIACYNSIANHLYKYKGIGGTFGRIFNSKQVQQESDEDIKQLTRKSEEMVRIRDKYIYYK